LVLLDNGSKINLSWWVANLIKYRLRHINELELLATLYSLKAFTSQLEGISIRLMMDNSTAVCYVNKAGGTRSKSLNDIAADIMCWCESRKISVHAVHLPGILNSLADLQSRWKRESSDWKLKTSVFSKLSELWAPEVDLFASHWNRQVARFMSWKPQPESVALDAFTQNPTKTWTSMVYPWDVNFGIWYIPFYIQWMYGEHPNYLPLDVLWGISKVRPKLSVDRIIIPIDINNLGLHHLYFFLYFSLLIPI
jgi:hypothetical protein